MVYFRAITGAGPKWNGSTTIRPQIRNYASAKTNLISKVFENFLFMVGCWPDWFCGLTLMKEGGWLLWLVNIFRQLSEQKSWAVLPLPVGYFSIMSKLYFFTWWDRLTMITTLCARHQTDIDIPTGTNMCISRTDENRLQRFIKKRP